MKFKYAPEDRVLCFAPCYETVVVGTVVLIYNDGPTIYYQVQNDKNLKMLCFREDEIISTLNHLAEQFYIG